MSPCPVTPLAMANMRKHSRGKAQISDKVPGPGPLQNTSTLVVQSAGCFQEASFPRQFLLGESASYLINMSIYLLSSKADYIVVWGTEWLSQNKNEYSFFIYVPNGLRLNHHKEEPFMLTLKLLVSENINIFCFLSHSRTHMMSVILSDLIYLKEYSPNLTGLLGMKGFSSLFRVHHFS